MTDSGPVGWVWVVEGTRLQRVQKVDQDARATTPALMDVRASILCSDLGKSRDGTRAALGQCDTLLVNATSIFSRHLIANNKL